MAAGGSASSTRRLGSAYSILYDSSNHFAVLTQLWGSLWPRVLPYCLFNVGIMVALTLLQTHVWHVDFQISNQGHTFISVVVAFLLISRVNTALGRFNESRGYLGIMYRETRELMSDMVVLTAEHQSPDAKAWRAQVAYRLLLLLRTSMAVIDYPTDLVSAWDIAELQGDELKDIQQNTYLLNADVRALAHEDNRSPFEESMRVPIRMSFLLKKAIHNHAENILVVAQENKLLASVDGFMNGYYGMRKFLTTPVPFPLVQMARTFLFAYVFTVPFVLLGDASSMIAHCVEVFILTYGFMGLELVSIELDNPFGDDENDFDNLALAHSCMEDAYLTLQDCDGWEAAQALRQKMGGRNDEQAKKSLGNNGSVATGTSETSSLLPR